MRVFFFNTIFFFAFVITACAQEWVDLARGNAGFFEVREAFERQWKGKPYERGKGYKQFKRWEYLMEQRSFPSGDRVNLRQSWIEFQRIRSGQEKARSVNWTPLGPDSWSVHPFSPDGTNPGNGRINAIAEEPGNPNTLYVGSPSGGLWKSTDGGMTWVGLTDDLPALGISAIAIHPDDPQLIFIGTGDKDAFDTYSIGVMKSVDGGQSWQPTGTLTAAPYVCSALLMHPQHPDTMFASTSNGVYRTLDGGDSWNQVLAGDIRDLEFHPANPDTLYACSDVFFRSTDGGATFNSTGTGLPIDTLVNRYCIAVTPDDPDILYVVAGNQTNSGFLGLYRSIDRGDAFTLQANSPNVFGYFTNGGDAGGQSWYDMALAVSPVDDQEVYTGGINIWKSQDGGTNLAINTQWFYPNGVGYVHADIHELKFFGNRLYACTDGGIFKSLDFGDTWTDLSEGLQITQFYRFGTMASNSDLILAGSQDNGVNLMQGANNWQHVNGADGMESVIHPTNSDLMYCMIQNGALRKSIDGGFDFFNSTFGINEEGAWVTPFQLDPTNPAILIAGYDNVWKSRNGANSWSKISTFNADKLNTLVMAPLDTAVIYASDDATFYATQNGGSTWDTIAGLPNLFITDIEVHPFDPDIFWVSYSGFIDGEKVYYTSDGGASWTNISAGLPNLPVNTVVRQQFTEDLLYAGTDVGVYYKSANMGAWQLFSDDLPNVIIQELEIHEVSGKLRAATYGRGLWEVDLPGRPIGEVVYVDPGSIGRGTGQSWSDAFRDLQTALFLSENDSTIKEIWLKTGTYTPHPNDQSASFEINSNVKIYGGFGGTEALISERNIEMNPVVLNGEIGVEGTSDDIYNIIVIAADVDSCLISDLEIIGGNADGPNPEQQSGAGVFSSGNGALNNVTISDCFAASSGSAVFHQGIGKVLTLMHCIIQQNSSNPAVSNTQSAILRIDATTKIN